MSPESVDHADDPRVAPFRDVAHPARVEGRGLFVAEGRLVVRRVLASPRFALTALLVTEPALAALRPDLERAASTEVATYVTTRAVLREIGGYDFHQGCLGLVRRPIPIPWADALPSAGGSTPGPLVVLERVGNPDNIGGVFRNASALGAAAVLLSPGCGDPLYRKAVRTSIGATLDLPFAVMESWPAGLTDLQTRGYEVVALTPAADAVPLRSYRPPASGRVALLLGHEGEGLSAGVFERATVRVRIPLQPPVDSLNVATAGAIALHQLRSEPLD